MNTQPGSSSENQHRAIRRGCSDLRVVVWQECERIFGFADYCKLSQQQASDWINLMTGRATVTVERMFIYFESPKVALITEQIKQRIPMHHRAWNPAQQRWSVRRQHLGVLTSIANQFRWAEIVEDGVRRNLKKEIYENSNKAMV